MAAIGKYQGKVGGAWESRSYCWPVTHYLLGDLAARDQTAHRFVDRLRPAFILSPTQHRSLMQTDGLFDPFEESPAILEFRHWLAANGASINKDVRFKSGKCFEPHEESPTYENSICSSLWILRHHRTPFGSRFHHRDLSFHPRNHTRTV